MSLENFKEQDYVSKTEINSACYKIFSAPNVKNSQVLYLYCQIRDKFSERIEGEQKNDVLDRSLRSFSNMVLNETFRSPDQYFKRMTEITNTDFLVLSEHLFGRAAASFMTSEQINKIIKSKQADLPFDHSVSIVNEFFNNEMKKDKDFVQNILGFGLRNHDELAEDMNLNTPLELALYNKDHKIFELLFNFCCKYGNKQFVYKVIMRNIGAIMSVKELNPNTESFFQEESPISFGMKQH